MMKVWPSCKDVLWDVLEIYQAKLWLSRFSCKAIFRQTANAISFSKHSRQPTTSNSALNKGESIYEKARCEEPCYLVILIGGTEVATVKKNLAELASIECTK